MAGLLDFLESPGGQGLLSGIASYAANARRGAPINSLGRGLVGGLAGYGAAQDQLQAQDENAFQRQYREMQMDQMRRQMETQRKQNEWRAGLPIVMTPKVSDQGAMLNEQDAAFGDEGTQATIASGQYARPDAPLGITPQVDRDALQAYLMQPESPYADKLMENMLMPSTEKPQLVTVYDEQGRPMQKWLRPGESDGVTVGMGKPDADNQSAIGKLIAERDKLPPGHPARVVYDQAIRKQTTHAPAAQLNNYGSPVAGIGPDGNPVFFQPSKGGGAPSIVPGVAPPPKPAQPPTEAEAKAAFYASNMRSASAQYDSLVDQGFDPTNPANQVGTAIAGGMTNPLAPKLAQQARQSQNQWAEQMLRMQTGAAATEDETKRTVRTYFPQVGDSPEVVAQKRAMRQQAEQGVFAASGRASNRIPEAAPKAGAFADADKERRYQEWKRSHGK